MIYTREQLVKIQEDAKILKSRIIVILPGHPGVMIGTDDTVSYFKIIPYDADFPSIWTTVKDAVPFTNSIPILFENMDMNYCDTIELPDDLRFNLLFNKILNGYKFYMDVTDNNNSIEYSDIHLNTDFLRIQSLPASKGATNWIIDNDHCIYLYTGLIPTVKSDKVSLSIFDYSPTTYVCRFTVDKGKKGVILIYIYCARL